MLPPADHETARTDVVGLLWRIAQAREREPQYVVIISDLADTQHRTLPSIPAPEGEIHGLVLLVPAQPKDALLTIGRALPAAEQFELRRKQLAEKAPWVAVAAHFARNLAPLLLAHR
jgi:hypothetical protein